jgi:hypothetical protein
MELFLAGVVIAALVAGAIGSLVITWRLLKPPLRRLGWLKP